MARTVTSGLQALLDKHSCNTQSTLSLYLADASEYHFATEEIETSKDVFTADLRQQEALQQSISSPTNRATVRIQNVDKLFGTVVTDEDLLNAEGVIGRFYRDENDLKQIAIDGEWVELFKGSVIPLEVNEAEVVLEVVHDLTAAGFCVGAHTLAENCQWVFKQPDTCGYSGVETTCNKKRKSKHGCIGRQNEHRFGGMEFPEPVVSAPPTGGGGGGGGGGFPSCPRLDQYVLARGEDEHSRLVRRVADIRAGQWLFDPVTNGWNKIVSAEIVREEPIWEMIAANGATGYSSASHRVLWFREHENGEPARRFISGDRVLTWVDQRLSDSIISTVRPTGEKADVMKIELAPGHIYCSGSSPSAFIVAHNSKEPE